LVEARAMPVRFIRYNPDVYEPMKGQRKVKLEQREKKLVEYVKYAMIHPPHEEGVFANVLYLFYDEHDTTRQIWEKII
jgi:hemerythrin